MNVQAIAVRHCGERGALGLRLAKVEILAVEAPLYRIRRDLNEELVSLSTLFDISDNARRIAGRK